MPDMRLELELSFEEFVEAYMQRIAALPDHVNIAFDPAAETIRYDHEGQTHHIAPRKAYGDYLAEHAGAGVVLDRQIAMLATAEAPRPPSLGDAAPRLLPMVRDRRYLDLALLAAQASGESGGTPIAPLPFRPLAGELVVTLALDAETSTSTVGEHELAAWGVGFDAALDIALQNLRSRTPDLIEPLAAGVYVSRWNDVYDASRLLLTDLLQRLHLRGDPVVCVPSRNVLLAAGAQDPDALALLAKAAADVLAKENRPLSADVLQFSGGRWIEGPVAVAQHPALARARHQLLQGDYAQQADLLNAVHKARGEDVFVAAYKLGKKGDDQPLFNYAQLSEGVSTLLPKADHLAFWTRSKTMIVVPWADAEAVFGHALLRLDMHPVRYRVDAFPNAEQLQALRAKAVIVQEPPDPKKALPQAAEKFRRAYEQRFGQPLDYDAAGLRLLETYLQQLHVKGVAPTDANVEGPAAFLGEFVIRHLGGEWVPYEDTHLVRFSDGNGVFPFAKVAKQIVNGVQGGDSVVGLYETTRVLQRAMSGALDDAQRRLAEYGRSHAYRIFVGSTLDAERPWAEVKEIAGNEVRLGHTLSSARGTMTVYLPQITRYCVFDLDGALVHAEALPPELAALPAAQLLQAIERGSENDPAELARRSTPFYVAAQGADADAALRLTRLRDDFAALRRAGNVEAMRALKPLWVKDDNPLAEIARQQKTLLNEGTIVWAALVMVNNAAFKPGPEDLPGALVYSFDPHFDARPHELREIAHRIFALKKTRPADPDVQRLARRITDETDLSIDWDVPAAFTDRTVLGTTFLAFRRHLPRGVMCGGTFPILAHPGTRAVTILPCRTWPDEMTYAWQPAGNRDLKAIRDLPEGIRVTHAPARVHAVVDQDGEHFVWQFQTTVESTAGDLQIVEFGAFELVDGHAWQFANMGGEPFDAAQFAEWYGCADGVLKPGAPVRDPRNWHRSTRLRSSRSLWYYIGRNAAGKLFRGEAEVDELGTLIAPDDGPEPTVPARSAGGLVARLFGKAAATHDALRFDGVYRAKHEQYDDNDPAYVYLRLYPDGAALLLRAAEYPSDLRTQLVPTGKYTACGSYKVKGDTIEIGIPSNVGTLVLAGAIDRNRLRLQSRRLSNRTVDDEFLFMGWKP